MYQQTFTGFLPSLSFFSAGKGKRLNIYYNLNVRAPQAYQLQPVVDNTNPLYLRLGNPDLKYALVQTVQYNFNYYNTKKEKGFNSCFKLLRNPHFREIFKFNFQCYFLLAFLFSFSLAFSCCLVRVLGVCFGIGVHFPLVYPPLRVKTHTRTHTLSLLCRVCGCHSFFLPPGDQM